MAKASFAKTFNHDAAEHWWFGGHHLYEVFLKPIYFGPAAEDRQLGFLIVGYEIDERVASQVSRIASSQVVFYYADDIVRSTLPLLQESELVRQSSHPGSSAAPEDLRLGDEQFLSESIELARGHEDVARVIGTRRDGSAGAIDAAWVRCATA